MTRLRMLRWPSLGIVKIRIFFLDPLTIAGAPRIRSTNQCPNGHYLTARHREAGVEESADGVPAATHTAGGGGGGGPPYRDATLPVVARVADLVARMTLPEKAGLLFHTMIGIG